MGGGNRGAASESGRQRTARRGEAQPQGCSVAERPCSRQQGGGQKQHTRSPATKPAKPPMTPVGKRPQRSTSAQGAKSSSYEYESSSDDSVVTTDTPPGGR
ncbi:unnamed protein product [Prorocentrum cordatum]|uniref:Uncharacterized protein n=1 Tax=Prorocentrum cordatum TaxID=2364126 RepID=A0ABN9US45_9DINO|nr:unnamed protein product [Polarella glacialis]